MIALPHEDKIAKAELWLRRYFGEHSDFTLRRVNEAGLNREWLIEYRRGSELSLKLKVIIPPGFPAEMISVQWLHGTQKHYPHCFPSGQLCFYEHPFLFADIDDDMNCMMVSVAELINECHSGANEADFFKEPRPYWGFHQEKAGKKWRLSRPVVVNIAPRSKGNCALIYGIQAQKKWYVAEDIGLAKDLALSDAGEINELTYSIGVRIPMARAWHPDQFPHQWRQVYKLMQECERYSDAMYLLEQAKSKDCWLASIFIYFDAPEVSYGFQLPIIQGHQGLRGRELVKRPLKKMSVEDFFRSKQAGPVAICTTHSLDGDSLFSRLAVPDMSKRHGARILLVGCGSLGAMVAEELVVAGVRNLTLVDPDSFSAENLCRHVLGIDSLGRPKVEALKKHLKNKMSRLDISTYPVTIAGYLHHQKTKAEDFDLILAMTGESGPVWMLDTWRRQSVKQVTPMLVGWAEAYGLAGHAALLMDNKSMKEIENNAERKHNLIQWPQGVANYLLREPGCSTTFQPMGRSKLMHIAALNVETALKVLDGDIDSAQVSSYVEPLPLVKERGAISKSDWVHQSVEPFQAGIIRRDV